MRDKYRNVKEVTPAKMRCGIGACNSVYEASKDGKKVYLIVGGNVNPVDAGLIKKVGLSEGLIEVPRELIDGMGR